MPTYRPRFSGMQMRILEGVAQRRAHEQEQADREFEQEFKLTQERHDAQMLRYDQQSREHDLRVEEMEWERDFMLPLKEREARLMIQQRKRDSITHGMETELAQKNLDTQLQGTEQVMGLQNSYASLSPEDRAARIPEYTEEAKKIYFQNPTPQTEEAFRRLAMEEIRMGLSPDAYQTNGNDETVYRDNIERWQSLKNKFRDYPQIDTSAIDERIQMEFGKPQYWSQGYNTFYEELSPRSQAILDRGKAGKLIYPQERATVEAEVQELLAPTKKPASYLGAAFIENVIMRWPEMDETQRAMTLRVYPELRSAVGDAGSGGTLTPPPVNNGETPDSPSRKDPVIPEAEKEAAEFLEKTGVLDKKAGLFNDVGAEVSRIYGMAKDSVTTDDTEFRLKQIEQELQYWEGELDKGVSGAASRLNQLYKEQDRLIAANPESVTESVTRAPGRVQEGVNRLARETGLIKFLANMTGDKRYYTPERVGKRVMVDPKDGEIRPYYYDHERGQIQPVPDGLVKPGKGRIYYQDRRTGEIQPWED